MLNERLQRVSRLFLSFILLLTLALPALAEPPLTPAEQKRQQTIERLLRQAEDDLAAVRLTQPKGNNAYERYQWVLILDPSNQAARAGISRIVGKYVAMAQRCIRTVQLDRAEAYLAKARKISWRDHRVMAAREQLQTARQTVGRSGGPPKHLTNSIGMFLRLIPAGSFMMGSHESPEVVAQKTGQKPGYNHTEYPLHKVNITKPFYMQTSEVTQGQWRAVMGDNPSYFKKCGPDCPVEFVGWHDAQKFIQRLNKMEGTTKYRLPTEAEWEYACRAGTTTPYSFGETISHHVANYNGTEVYGKGIKGIMRGQTEPVKSHTPNKWGLYDMHGNVWEWVSDWFGDDYYANSPANDPQGPGSGKYKVIRGGDWVLGPYFARSANRGATEPKNGGSGSGFRVARDAP